MTTTERGTSTMPDTNTGEGTPPAAPPPAKKTAKKTAAAPPPPQTPPEPEQMLTHEQLARIEALRVANDLLEDRADEHYGYTLLDVAQWIIGTPTTRDDDDGDPLTFTRPTTTTGAPQS